MRAPGATLEFFLQHARRDDPLLVGEAPGEGGDPGSPLTGSAGRRIARAAALQYPGAYMKRFGRINLLDEFPGRETDGGAAFPVARANARAAELCTALAVDRAVGEYAIQHRFRIVLFGRRVAAAFGFDATGWFVPWHMAELAGVKLQVTVWTAPHPSGLSRWWSEPENERAARVFFLGLRAGQRAPG